MPHIFRVHQEMDFCIDRDRHFGGHNVVAGVHIMLGIETKNVLISFVDEFGMKTAELPIHAGVAEVKGKLSSLDLDRHGISGGRVEVNIGPGLYAEDSEGHDFDAYNQDRTNHQTFGAAGKFLELGIGGGVGELPNKKR